MEVVALKIAGMSIWGDSIAKGVVYDEQRDRYMVYRDHCLLKLERETGLKIDNHAVMGNTSSQGLARMEKTALPEGYLAIIEYGGNDCDLDWKQISAQPEKRQFGRVPLERFSENIRKMILRTREAGMKPILVTPPPLIAQRYFNWVARGLDASRILKYLGDVEHIYRWQERYALMIRKIAQQENVFLLDVRDMFLAENHLSDLMCVDGIHPNAAGHDRLYTGVFNLLAHA